MTPVDAQSATHPCHLPVVLLAHLLVKQGKVTA
jgi:hypothetical protein